MKKKTNQNKIKSNNNKNKKYNGAKWSSNNPFNKKGVFHTTSRLSGSISIPGTSVLQRIDIIPALSVFPVEYKNFLNYKIDRVRYQLIPRFNIATMGGNLPVIYSVPVSSSQLPAATTSAFTAFANCKVSRLCDTFTGSFAPVAYTSTGDTGAAMRSPLLKTTQDQILHYGHCLLISKTNQNSAEFVLVVEIDVTLINADN